MSNQNPYAPPQADVTGPTTADENTEIGKLPVSEKWKARFYLIKKAGGPKLPLRKALSASERRKVGGFNVLGFFFGPIYYATKGMWRKGLSLFALSVVIIVVVELVLSQFGYAKLGSAASYGVGAIYAVRANIDYYKKMVLVENGWW